MGKSPMKRFLLVIIAISGLLTMMPTVLGAQKVEITLATWHWTEPGRSDVYKAMVDAFTKEHPEITVKPVSLPYARYQDQMMIQMAGNQGPDILGAADVMFFAFMDRGYLQPLDKLINFKALEKDFLDAQKIAKLNGAYYGLVTEYVTYALLYNEDMLKEAGINKPPATPEEFMAAAKKLTKAPDQYALGTRHSMNEEGGWWYEMSFWVEGFGGKWTTNGRPSVNTDAVINAVKFYKEMYDAGIFPKGVDAATYRRMFWQGKIAMLTDNQATLFLARSSNPSLNLMAAPSPFKNRLTNAEIYLKTIPKSAKHPKEAALFLEWFYKHLKDYGLGVQNVTGSKSANKPILEKYPFLQTFVDAPLADNGGILPKGYETRQPEFRHIVLQHVTNVLVNNADPKAEMNAAQAELLRLKK